MRAGRDLAVGDALLQLDDRELADLDLLGGRGKVRVLGLGLGLGLG